MTQKELHDQRLVKEAQARSIRMHTRRHFLKESAMGLGALAIGSLLGNCGSRSRSCFIHIRLIQHIRCYQSRPHL